MWKRVRCICLAFILGLAMFNIDFVKAEEPLALELFLADKSMSNALIASLTDYELAEDEVIWAEIYWSLDNITFHKEADLDGDWCEVSAGKRLDRPCLLETNEALSAYLKGTIDTLYVKLKVHSSLGFSKWTEVAVLKKPLPGENVINIKAMYPSIPLNMMMGSFRNRCAEYHVTVTENENGYAEVLPEMVPVTFSLIPEEVPPYGDGNYEQTVLYDVVWEKSEDTENRYIAVSMQNRVQEDYYFVAMNRNFRVAQSLFPLNPLEEPSMAMMNKWYCTVHPVPQGYVTSIELVEDTDTGTISAQLPLKPTGMTRIEIEASTDGGESWKTVDTITAEENPVDYMPKEEGYSIHILAQKNVERLLSEGQGTFHVRLKIVNGALGNQCVLEGSDGDTYTYSESAVWTGPYVELPPEEDDENKEDGADKEDDTDKEEDSDKDDDFSPGNENDENSGSGGNNGNVGTDNSGETNGQRPGVDTSPGEDDSQNPPVDPETPSEDELQNGNTQTPTEDESKEDESQNGTTQPPSEDESKEDESQNGNPQTPSEDETKGDEFQNGTTQPPSEDESKGDESQNGTPQTPSEDESKENDSQNGNSQTLAGDDSQNVNQQTPSADSRKNEITTIAAYIAILAAGCGLAALIIKRVMSKRMHR